MVDDEVWDNSSIARAVDCLAEIAVAAEELHDLEGLEDQGLSRFAEGTQRVAEAYRQKLLNSEERSS
jgi:hypothetical protein